MSAAAAAPASFPRLEKYELLEEIGHGGMATVYRARDPRLGREVAVKVIHRHLRENAEVEARFVAEARAAAKLRHPGIVDVYDVSNEDDPERYLVVELVRGTTLRKVLLQHRDMPAEVAAAIVQQICFAVDHAHAASIIHRDIKPENVLVELPQDRLCRDDGVPVPSPAPVPAAPAGSRDEERDRERVDGDTQRSVEDAITPHGMRGGGKAAREKPAGPGPKARPEDRGVVIKITDFGIAKLLDAQGVTSTGQVLGSPAHMAPEQIEGGEVDCRTDVFALGVLLYECLVGHLPFEGKNPAQVLRRVLDGVYPPADRERPSVGGRWARIVASALAHDPAERTPSAAALGEQIKAELEALGIPDARAEVAAYFADPAGHTEAHKALMVPRLSVRGEAARKAGDVWGAAADWNRALALAPHDLTLLKRMASLTSSAGRRQLVRRAAVIAAGSAALGIGAFGIARALKGWSHRDHAPPVGTASAQASDPPLPSVSVNGTTQTSADATAIISAEPPRAHVPTPTDTSAHVVRIAATPTAVLAPPPPSAAVASVRMVRFFITPKGARLSVDGGERAGWMSTPFQLAVGGHKAELTPLDPKCCRAASSDITVEAPPAGKPDEEQRVHLSMPLNPAQVSLAANAPAGASVFCPEIGLRVSAGVSVPAKLREPKQTVTCAVAAPDQAKRPVQVTLEAGGTTVIPWPK